MPRPRTGGAGPVLAAALVLAGAAGAQTDPYSAMVEGVCRGYAGAQVGEPAALAFAQCMAERHCRAAEGATGYICERPQPLSWHGGGY